MERVFHPDGPGPNYVATPEDTYPAIASALYHSIVEPFRLQSESGVIDLRNVSGGSATNGILKGLKITTQTQQLDIAQTPELSDFIVQFAAPMQAIATGRRSPLASKNAELIKPMFDRVSAAIADSSREASSAIALANNTRGFWNWAQQQLVAMGSSRSEGLGLR